MDLTSRLRSIVRPSTHASGVRSGPPAEGRRELTYEPDGGYHVPLDLDRVADILGGRTITTSFGKCLVIDRRYEADRFHGDIRIDDCNQLDVGGLLLLDPDLFQDRTAASGQRPADSCQRKADSGERTAESGERSTSRTLFLDLETTGLSGGAGTIAFLVGCGYFDFGAFQVTQFLLPSHAAERALLAAVAEFFDGADLIVTYNGKTFDLPVMETRWLFHRMTPPLDGVPHFDMLHPARRLWRTRSAGGLDRSEAYVADARCCRLSTLERLLFDVERVGDVDGFEIPGRFFRFVRNGDPRPLEPVLEHNRLDLVSLAAVTARAARLAQQGHDACRSGAEALALGRIYERADALDRAEACYRRAAEAESLEIKVDALYRLALRFRRDRRFEEAAALWREILSLTEKHGRRRPEIMELRRFATEALAIHHEHRRRDFAAAHQHALSALEHSDAVKAEHVRHRIARIERKMAAKKDAQLFPS